MTATINAATAAGVVTTADTAGILKLKTNGTAALTVDASQNVGIGITSPTRKLAVSGTWTNTGDYLMDSGSPQLAWTSGDLRLKTGGLSGTEQVRFPSTGGIQSVTTISVGNATPSTSGAGITFPATQSVSSDANTLDDYEEGTWTPALAGEGGGSNTFTVKYGYYTKVGRLVTITFATSAIASPNAQTNSWNITGLPFQSANLTATQAVLWGGSFSHYRQFPVQASSTGLFPSCRPNTATLRISVMYGGPAQTETTYVTGGTPSATLEISGTITYETA